MDTQHAKIYVAVAIASVLLGVILIFFAWTLVRQQRRQWALQRKLLQAELGAIETERSRIASDLHDELAPRLSAARFQVDYVQDQYLPDSEDLPEVSRNLDALIDSMREIANNLMPTALQRKGLEAAIEELAARFSQRSGVLIHTDLKQLHLLPEEQQVHIYRMVQEMIHNCIKHAAASNVELKLHYVDQKFVLRYRDNGKGFDLTRMNKSGTGIGLQSLQTRAEYLGGELIIESKPGVGTAYLLEITL